MRLDWRAAARLIVSLVIPQAAGAIGAVVTMPAITGWYRGLEKPGFTPPAWVFGPAWTLLYLLMGIALFLVWQKTPRDATKDIALAMFAGQLVLNVAWSFIFFGLRAPGPAFAEIVILWVAILLTIVFFLRLSRPAGLLLLPYLAWVTFAAALNFAVWRLN